MLDAALRDSALYDFLIKDLNAIVLNVAPLPTRADVWNHTGTRGHHLLIISPQSIVIILVLRHHRHFTTGEHKKVYLRCSCTNVRYLLHTRLSTYLTLLLLMRYISHLTLKLRSVALPLCLRPCCIVRWWRRCTDTTTRQRAMHLHRCRVPDLSRLFRVGSERLICGRLGTIWW
jgi:hypothetical protein